MDCPLPCGWFNCWNPGSRWVRTLISSLRITWPTSAESKSPALWNSSLFGWNACAKKDPAIKALFRCSKLTASPPWLCSSTRDLGWSRCAPKPDMAMKALTKCKQSLPNRLTWRRVPSSRENGRAQPAQSGESLQAMKATQGKNTVWKFSTVSMSVIAFAAPACISHYLLTKFSRSFRNGTLKLPGLLWIKAPYWTAVYLVLYNVILSYYLSNQQFDPYKMEVGCDARWRVTTVSRRNTVC